MVGFRKMYNWFTPDDKKYFTFICKNRVMKRLCNKILDSQFFNEEVDNTERAPVFMSNEPSG